MNFEFNTNQKYTIVEISDSAITTRSEIETLGTDPATGRISYKIGRQQKRYDVPSNLDDVLVFQGHHLPFTVDVETESFVGNAQFNFVTDDLPTLRDFITNHCLNKTEGKFAKILVWGVERFDLDLQTPVQLFDDQQIRLLFNSSAE
jgi:hypothetical protein